MISKCKLLLTHLLSNARYTTLSMTSTSKYYSIWETKYLWSYNNRLVSVMPQKMVSKHLLVVVQSKHSVVEAGKD